VASAIELNYRNADAAQLSGLDLTGAGFEPLDLDLNTHVNGPSQPDI
jgi:hypothetical protein